MKQNLTLDRESVFHYVLRTPNLVLHIFSRNATSTKIHLNEIIKGIPEFWFSIMKQTPPMDQIIEDHDEPILEHLIDVRCKLSECSDQMAFTLEFEFSENNYFSNSLLTKTYKLQNMLDEDDPLGYEGPEIISCEGCKIDWKEGMNVTEKIVKKRQKHKGRGTGWF